MTTRTKAWITYGLFALVFLFSYINQFLYHYEVPQGGDALGHNAIVHTILGGDYGQIFRYHTVWHSIIAVLSLALSMRTLTVMVWLAPALLVSMAMALMYFNYRFLGIIAGWASLIIIGFMSQQPIQTLYDGGFPNVLAAGTVLPFVLIALDNIFNKKRRYWLSILLFLLSLVILIYSHHLTTLYSLVTIALFLLFELIRYWRHKSVGWWKIISFLLLCYLLTVGAIALFLNSNLPISFQGLAKQFVQVDFKLPFIHFVNTTKEMPGYLALADFPDALGHAVVGLGLGGFAVAVYYIIFRPESPKRRVYTLLAIWAYVLFLGSQVIALGFPARLARDLAIPLALLGGAFVAETLGYIHRAKIPKIFGLLFVVACLALGSVTFINRYQRALAPNPLIHHLSVDTRAADYITKNLPVRNRIVIFQDDIYLQDFTVLHSVYRISSQKDMEKMTALSDPEKLLRLDDYIYLEERFDQPESWINNHGIIETYLKSPKMQFITSFEQPEKKVYLFQAKGIPAYVPSP